MPISIAVQAALRESNLLSEWIGQHYPLTYKETGHLHIAMSLYAIAGEHREAFKLLLNHDAKTSAFALARSVYEAFMRGLWAETIMTPERYATALERREFPKFETIMSDLQKQEEEAGAVGKSKRLLWKPLSNFSHGGFNQVMRWHGEEGIEPCHSDDESIQMLGLVDLYGLCAFIQAANLASVPPSDLKQHCSQVLARLRKSVSDP